MKYYLKIIYPLVVITVFFGFALALTYQLLSAKLDETDAREVQSALSSVMPAASQFTATTNGDSVYYAASDASGATVGYVFKKGNAGYGGPVVTLIGVNLEGRVEGIRIVDASSETPGLGYKCMEAPWQAQFAGLTLETTPRSKEGFAANGLNAITGSTFTSMAVANNIYDALTEFASMKPTTNGGDTNG